MKTRRKLLLVSCAALAMQTAAADYPERPVRFIVPQAAGSASDTSARIVATELTRILGQQVVVDNRPGGGNSISIEMVVRAASDGYTVGYLNKIALRLNQRPRKTLGFKTPADKLTAVLQ